jgi:hypothetical protein
MTDFAIIQLQKYLRESKSFAKEQEEAILVWRSEISHASGILTGFA